MSDDGYHLNISTTKGVVNDFRTSYKEISRGSFLSFVMKHKNISFKEAIEEVIGEINDKNIIDYSNILENKKYIKNNIELPENFIKLTYEDDSISPIIKRYLNSRCVPNGKIYVYRIGYSDLDVVFPYYENNRVVYWQKRSITNKQFTFPPDSNKTQYIYGYDYIDPKKPVIVTESIFNSLMFDNAVAIGGSEISSFQRDKLRKLKIKKIIMALDNDEAGKAGISKAYDCLHQYFDLYYSLPPTFDEDWNDITKKFDKEYTFKCLKKNISKLDYKESIKLKIS